MKNKTKTEWQKCFDHLTSGRWFNCCMKLKNPDGGMPKRFGVLGGLDRTKLYLLDKKTGEVTGEFIQFDSIESMLNADWEVD
jgi:hypothetical protein